MKVSAKIGVIQILEDRVRACVVQTGGAAPTMLDRIETPIGGSTDEEGADPAVDAVWNAVRGLSSMPNCYVLSASSLDSVVRVLRIPVKGARRVAAAVQFELEPYLAFPIEELAVDHLPIREVEGQTEVLAVGMRRAVLDRGLAALRGAGVEPEGIGLDALGLTALWLCGRKQVKGLNALVHFQERGATLVVLADRHVAFMRPMADVTAASVREAPRVVAREITNLVRAFLTLSRAKEPLAGVHVTGLAPDPDLEGMLGESLNAPVAWTDLSEVVRYQEKKPKSARKRSAEGDVEEAAEAGPNVWESLAGMAFSAAGGGPALNFRRGELAPRNVLQGVGGLAAFTLAMAAILCLSYAGYCYVDYTSNVQRIERAGEEIWRLYTEAFPDSPDAQAGRPPMDIGGVRTLALMRRDFDEHTKQSSELNTAILTRPTLLDILNEISTHLSADKILLTELRVRSSRERSQQVSIVGELTDPGAFEQELEKLRQSKVLKVTGEPTISQRQGKTTFTITAST